MTNSATPKRKIPVIIDTDPGVDDTIAILLALTLPELDILGFIVHFGNTDLEASYINIFKIYHNVSLQIEKDPASAARFPNFSQARKPFVARGPAGPLSGELHSASYFHGKDGLSGITATHPELNPPPPLIGSPSHPQLAPTDRPGHLVALDLLREFPAREITYIALGPLTNLAHMLRTDAQLVREKIGRVVIMGGALDVPGNTSPVAEFNFFADPYAVAEVLTPTGGALGLPLERVLLLPLDITTSHELPFPAYGAAVDAAFSQPPSDPDAVLAKNPALEPIAYFTSAIFGRLRGVMNAFGNDAMELHDITAVWCAAHNPPQPDAASDSQTQVVAADGWSVRRRIMTMERTGEHTRGMCIVDRRADVGAYAPGANRAHVQAILERAAVEHGPFESAVLPAQVEVEEVPPPSRSASEPEEGVPVVISTPGPAVLLELMLERIWGVQGAK
ncbi:nucleoside hydrolase [Auriscalpium vulgare]|uniref:Nucleoside hydrolase n=1 Tax=Auriscalpium vulgare TaxID=40419 RepID=A0ACB8RK68_9AGAM|nr:nucleoside hydrolase [Auriscalpium vulgare]